MGLFVIRTSRGAYWGPNRGGYVFDVDEAGLYVEAEARRLAKDIRCGATRADEVIPAENFIAMLQARQDRITEFLVSVALGSADDAMARSARDRPSDESDEWGSREGGLRR